MKATRVKRLLPYNYQNALDAGGGPLAAILEVMEQLHARPEAVLSQLDMYFDPYRAPDAFVPFLASWVDLEIILERSHASTAAAPFRTGTGRLRELIQAAATLSRWRGTRMGLLLFLETATGVSGFSIDEETTNEKGKTVPFHLRILAPPECQIYQSLLNQLIELEKPAYVTYELIFAEAAHPEIQ